MVYFGIHSFTCLFTHYHRGIRVSTFLFIFRDIRGLRFFHKTSSKQNRIVLSYGKRNIYSIIGEVKLLRIYLDMCCYNRPYDDQSQLKITMETQSKLYIQTLIKEKKLNLITSYMLRYECSNNPFEMRRNTIFDFINKKLLCIYR